MKNLSTKRFFLSLIIALSVHFLFLFFLPSFFISKTDEIRPEHKSVMVTMSYKSPEVIKETNKKSVSRMVRKKETTPPKAKKIKAATPKKKIEKMAEKKPVIPVKKNLPEKKERRVPEKTQPPIIPESEIPEVPKKKAEDLEKELMPPLQTKEKQQIETIQQPEQNQKKIHENLIRTITFTAPEYKNNPKPSYPKKARKKGYEGQVELMVLITTEGRVAKVKIKKSAGHRILDRQAEKTVEKWTFKPRENNGHAIEAWVIISIRFELH